MPTLNSTSPSTAPFPLTATTIAIVGAGFSGVAVAARLLSQRGTPPLKIVLINASGKRARGVAYGTESNSHVLNVPAGRMSIWPEQPDDFLQFLYNTAQSAAPIDGHDFVPRSRYGDYLEHVLHSAQQNSPHQLLHAVGRVTDIALSADTTFTLQFADGANLVAHKVVLALGNFQPQNPHLAQMTDADAAAAFNHPAYLRDPWSALLNKALEALPGNARVLLLGTGLSMLDVAMLLQTSRIKPIQIDAISRRGLLPQAHRVAVPGAHFAPHKELIPSALQAMADQHLSKPASILAMLRAMRTAIAAHAPGDWRDVIAAIRPITPALWCSLSAQEQQRFIRHLAPYWDTHRHRAAPVPAFALKSAIGSGQIRPKSARIVALQGVGEQLLASIKARGSDAVVQQNYDLVINCTGPQNTLLQLSDTLIDSMLQRGLARKLNHGAGFVVDENLNLNAAGLHYVGPLLRANFWEATAVPELREHARTVADAIIKTVMQ